MEEMGIISSVDEPTTWCSGMVVVPKANGLIRICVDLGQLNDCGMREVYPLPSVDKTLAQLAGAKVFSKLPANSGFWPILLASASCSLTTFVIPQALQAEMLVKLHQGHQGIERCRLRATEAVCWPGIPVQIEKMKKRCLECVKRSQPQKEPMIMTKCPDYLWQKVAADLFQLKTATYLAVVDYFSRYMEVAKLGTTTSNQVIQTLKGIFFQDMEFRRCLLVIMVHSFHPK